MEELSGLGGGVSFSSFPSSFLIMFLVGVSDGDRSTVRR